jgi:exodeoxyribonuclease V alpha subunit
MFETTGREAVTIHRLLGCYGSANGRPAWQRDAAQPIAVDVVIVDESSMVDIELFDALLDAIVPTRTRLIMIGDADQLPPVGPGRPFGDLIDSGLLPVAVLQHTHRSAAESWVCTNAPLVLRGARPALDDRHDFRFVRVKDSTQLMPELRRLVLDVVPGLNADCQVLIPQRPGVAGINTANIMLQSALNPERPGEPYMQRTGYRMRVGDRVIHTKNNYRLNVFNGEVGEITALDATGVAVDLAGRERVVYTLEQAQALQHSYALTVHRAQGSEFPWVIVVCHPTHSYTLSRQLIYTAITRAKAGVILLGDEAGLQHALDDRRRPQRNTSLIARMKGTAA